jgi:hypothetical protein
MAAVIKPKLRGSLLDHAIAHAGIVKGARICAFITQWTIASQAIGREITLAEYAEWWDQKERTAFHHQAEFRSVFAPLSTPQTIANHAIARAEAMQHGVKGVGNLPASLVLS